MSELVVGPDGRARCPWASTPDYRAYHDEEWGRRLTGDQQLFERLTLEAFQSGLSWLTILRKRPLFRAAFDRFDIARVASYGEQEVARLLADPGIVRNRAKIEAAVANARAALDLPDGLSALLWSFAPPPRRERPAHLGEVPARTPESTAMAKELKRRNFRFVGPTTAYALMQAVGMVDDHLAGCHVTAAERDSQPLGGTVSLVPYDPAWPQRFARLRDELAAALGSAALRIDHVGSTAVPGLAAKDVIDIQVVVADDGDLDSYRPAVESTGVSLRFREPGWSMFRPVEGPRTHHVHVTSAGGERQRTQLLFVDYLRAHDQRRQAYEALKRDLVAKLADDRESYTAAKTEFVQAALRDAERWAVTAGWRAPGQG